MLKKKYSVTLLKMVRPTVFSIIIIGVGTTAMGFYSGRERLASTLSVGTWVFIAKE